VEREYLSVLREMRVAVRFSAAGINEKYRSQVDRRCGNFRRTLDKISTFTNYGIPTVLRIQPVIPGFEQDALEMTRIAAKAGVRRVSFEYLKLPKETIRTQIKLLGDVVGFDLLEKMRAQGLNTVGWDYSLTASAKRPFVLEARRVSHDANISFGGGDSEFIPLSDGDGCCGSTSDLLPGSYQFKANLVGAVKAAVKTRHKQVYFSDVKDAWFPRHPVSTYLDTRSRGGQKSREFDWIDMVARRWNGDCGPYSPDFFNGVQWLGNLDADGMRVYDASELASLL
jgi:hypothetical protein